MDEVNKRRRFKENKYSKEEVLEMFMELIDGKVDGCEVEEFVIVARSKYDGKAGTDIFSTTGNLHEVMGMLEVGKMFFFDSREME